MAERRRGCGRIFNLLGRSNQIDVVPDTDASFVPTLPALDPRTEARNLDRSLVDLKATVLEPIVQAYIGEVKSEDREE